MKQFIKDGWKYGKFDVIGFCLWTVCLIVNIVAWVLDQQPPLVSEILVNVCLLMAILQIISLKIDSHSQEVHNEDSVGN